MAEKEERTKDIIYVFSQEQVCKMCEGKRHGICDCCSWEQMPHLSRQEAIERIAKALRSNIVETQAQCSCLNMAEAALDALLERK